MSYLHTMFEKLIFEIPIPEIVKLFWTLPENIQVMKKYFNSGKTGSVTYTKYRISLTQFKKPPRIPEVAPYYFRRIRHVYFVAI